MPADVVQPLAGYTVGITGHRRWEEQAELLARRGAHILHGPVTAMSLLDEVDATLSATRTELAAPADDRPARRLLDAATRGQVDALTFTSANAVGNAFALTPDPVALARAMSGPVAAVAIGPVTADALRDHGVSTVVEPRTPRLGAMVHTLTRVLVERSRRLSFDGASCRWQGACLIQPDGSTTELTAGEHRLLRLLADRAPGVVAKDQLGDEGVDEHAVESAIARLRVKLGPLGPGIRTVRRRGYACELRPQPLSPE